MNLDIDLQAAATPALRSTGSLDGRVLLREELDQLTCDRMFELLSGHFVGVERATFDSDLDGKQCVVLLEDEGGSLRGFSTMALYSTEAVGRRISVVYSGDTIVERDWWGSPALPRTWIRAVRRLATIHGAALGQEGHRAGGDTSADLVRSSREPWIDELYWLLLTSGFRTYRFLPVFFRSFHPRAAQAVDSRSGSMLDAIARERFGAQYNAADGIVRFEKPQVLIPELLELPQGRMLDPHIAYFLERNPGYVHGDELACLARISDDNLTPAGRRMVRATLER